MRIATFVLLAGFTAAAQLRAQVVNFSGPYDVSHWTTTAPIGGSIDLSQSPASVTLIGPDQNSGGNLDFTIAAVASGNISFHWSYASTDDPFADKAYWLKNGAQTYIFGNDSTSGSGDISFTANTGDTIGFRVYSTDGGSGPGVLTISGFTAVPEPTTCGLAAGVPLLTFAFLRRFRAKRGQS